MAFLCCVLLATAAQSEAPGGLPFVDLAGETHRQVVLDREDGQYLGHVTTVLLRDGRTLLATYPKGHGRGPIVMKRSPDGGRSWSERLSLPESWATSREVPTIFPVRSNGKRLLLFSGLNPVRRAVSEDEGKTWSELEPVGDWGGIVAMASMAVRADGTLVTFFHDDGRFIGNRMKPDDGRPFWVFQSVSTDGGLSWGDPEVAASHEKAHLCEPGLVVSPDGETWALLLRENSRRYRSMMVMSKDEGRSWSEPVELPAALTGDRHTAVYAPDGRLFISFRDMAKDSPTHGDWVAWMGTWDDIAEGRAGQARIRLEDNTKGADCAYPGVEILPDGTIFAATYGHWTKGASPWILGIRLTLDEVDIRIADLEKSK